MSKEAKRIEFEPRQALIDAGITKIIAQIEDSDAKSITIEHDQGDRKAIVIPLTKDWYGDTRETFRLLAEKYFIPEVVLQLEREIGGIHLQVYDEVAKIQEKQAAEARQRAKEARARILSGATEAQENLPELERISGLYGTDEHPCSVKQALYAPPTTMVVVQGQIVAKGKVHHMNEGGMYRCMRCHQPQPIRFERPLSPTDQMPFTWNAMCRRCEKEHLSQNSPEFRAANQLILVKPLTINAIRIELMDTEAIDEPDSLQVAVFAKDAENLLVGEYAVITGRIYSLHSTMRGGLFYPVLYAHSIRYINKEVYQLTTKDIDRVAKFVKLAAEEIDPVTGKPLGEKNIITRLVWMNGHHIVGNELGKEALLYTEASAGPDRIGKGSSNYRRKRLNTGIVGNPGLGKSTLARIIQLHDERNRYESAQSSSGKTITAIVTKEGDSTPILRIGAVAHAKEATCAINELGEMSFEEQKHLQDSWEEGEFSINKNGIHARIRADTAAVWTSNPKQGAMFSNDSYDNKISIEEIPVRKQLLDRTDFLIVMKPIKDPDEKREFNRKRLEIEQASPAKKKILGNYDEYVKIHLMAAKQFINNPTLTEAAAEKVNEADVRIQIEREKASLANVGSNRALDTLIRTTTVIARLKFHKEATAQDATEAIEFYNKSTAQLHSSIVVPEDPAVISCNMILYILQNESAGIALPLRTLAEMASTKDPAVRWYLMQGPKNRLGDVGTNARLQRVLGMLENIGQGKIKRTRMHPAEFMWIGGSGSGSGDNNTSTSDKGDSGTGDNNNNNNNNTRTNEGKPADVTDTADATPFAYTQKQLPNMSESDDKDGNGNGVQPENVTSATSATSVIADKHRIEEDETEYKIVKAIEMSAASYSDDKAIGKVSGCLFNEHDVWYNLGTTFPQKEWDIESVRKVLKDQTKKGRVVIRDKDPPGTYYFIRQQHDSDSVGGKEGDV